MLLLRLTIVVTLLVCYAEAKGPTCGPYRRACGLLADCYGKQCFCEPGYYGEPLVECHKSNEFQCVVKADPHLTAFEGATADLNFPCRYKLTQVQTPLEGAVPGLAFCSFEVLGYNKVIKGKYFVSGVEISLAIGDYAHQYWHQEDIIKFDIDDQGVETSDGGSTTYGTGVHATFLGVEVLCKFDLEQSFAILEIPRCGFSVKFRPHNDNSEGPISYVPAISIVAGQNTYFGETKLGRYPLSLCGETKRHGDTEHLYDIRALTLGLDTADQAVLYDALNSGLEQESFLEDFTDHVLQDKHSCQATLELFANCTEQRKSEAVKVCFRIFASKKSSRCLGIKVLEAFRACTRAVCHDKEEGCQEYKAFMASANCKRNKRVKQFCKKKD